MPVFVSLHLGQAQNGELALAAMVMSLFAVMGTPSDRAKLGRGVLLEAGRHDGVELLVLPSMGHHFVGVGAVVVAFQAMKVAA